MNINIIRASILDTKRLASIHVTAWKETYENIIPNEYLQNLSIEKREQNFKNDIANKDDLEFYFIHKDDSIVGILILKQNDDLQRGEIIAIYLLKAYWNSGIGTAVMNLVKKKFKELHYSKLILWVLADNTQAITFYIKNGFIRDDQDKTVFLGKQFLEIAYTFTL